MQNEAYQSRRYPYSIKFMVFSWGSAPMIYSLRELLGMPDKVPYATHGSCRSYVTAAFDCGQFICHFETEVDDIPRFDCHIEVYSSLARRSRNCFPWQHNIPPEVIQLAFEGNFTQE